MRSSLLFRSVLGVVLCASATFARDHAPATIRTLLRSARPDDAADRIYVQGQVVTVLRFDHPVDAARTKMIGSEGRFEPLGVVGNKVVLEPLRDLDSDEGLPLLVTLVDGTELPFLLRPATGEHPGRVDQQVNVFKNHESYTALHWALRDALKEKSALAEENARYLKEETSADHGLAALLASGTIEQTPFKLEFRFSGENEEAHIEGTVFRGKGKAAVIFKVKNLSADASWSMGAPRLATMNGQKRAVAVRATSREIHPGAVGTIALVADGSAFVEDGRSTKLLLEIYRQDGLQQAFVELDPSLVAE